jgi:O-antigen ligase
MSSTPRIKAPSDLQERRLSWQDHSLLALPGLALSGYFVVRGAVNAAVVALGLVCLVELARGRSDVRGLLADLRVRWLLAALAAPFLAVLLVQASHQEFVSRYFDGPSRFLIAGAALLVLLRRQIDFVRVAEFAVPLAIVLCAGWIFLAPQAPRYFWEGRAATYFIDPLMLSQHVVIFGFLCLFLVDATRPDPAWVRAFKYGAAALAVAVSLATQSRTGWTMVPVLAILWWIGHQGHRKPRHPVAGAAVVVVACLLAYNFSSVVQGRIDGAVHEIAVYLRGEGRDTSVGIRLSLFRASWIMFLQQPMLGWGYNSLPELKSIPGIAAFHTPLFEYYFVTAGAHNEWLHNMMRMGLPGLASRLLLYFVPLWIFASAAVSTDRRRRTNGYLGLTVVIGYLFAGLSSEVFNLIYAASLYALLVVLFAAGALPAPADRATTNARETTG